MATVYDFLNADSSEVEEQRVIRVAGTTGDVLTLQANGTVSPAPGGGSQPWRHDIVPIAYTDIDEATGLAPVFTLQPGEWLYATWNVVTETFDDTVIVNNQASVLLVGVATNPGDNLSTQETNASHAADGLIGPDPGAGPANKFVQAMNPVESPSGAAVAVVNDFTAGSPLAGDGTQGQMDIHLLILNAP